MVPILVALWLGTACKAELPEQLAKDASGVFPCTTFADLLISYSPPGTEGGSELGQRTLGAPNGDTVELVTDAVLSVSFLGLGSVQDRLGADEFRVHGTFATNTRIAVYVAPPGDDFVFSRYIVSGEDENGEIDIAEARVSAATSIQLVGIAGLATIDAFEALGTPCSN
ncbi:MAG: hypothetical protein GY811_08145 [Myxococcales bacterium]|nr:hypothetical protein [Myxococcales bacterium]